MEPTLSKNLLFRFTELGSNHQWVKLNHPFLKSPPVVSHSGLYLHGRKILPPSKDTSKSSVPQMAANDSCTIRCQATPQRLPCFTNFAQIGKGKDASKGVDIPTIPTLPTASFTFGSCRRCHMKSDCPKPNPWMIPFEGFGSQSILSWTATWWNCWTLPTKTKYLPAKIQPSSLLPQVVTSVRRTFVPGKACGRENKHQWMEMMSIPKPTCCNLPTATWLQESSGQDVRQKDCASKKSQSKDWVFSMSSFLAAFATTSGLGCDHVAGPFTWRYLFACQNCQCISWWNSLSLKLTAYPCSSK